MLSCIPIIILTQSRSGWVALFFTGIFGFVTFRKEIKKIIAKFGVHRLYVLLILVVFGTSIVFFPRIIASFNSFTENAGVPLRFEMQKEALTAIAKRPLTGYGIGTNEPVLLDLFPKGYVYSFPAPVHIHFYI
jgi:O-antigen ligase